MKNTQPDSSWAEPSIMEFQTSNLVDNALSAALVKSPQLYFLPTIPESEIRVSEDISQPAVKNYSSKVMEVLLNNLSSRAGFSRSDLEVLLEAIQTKDFTELDKYIKGYKDSYLAIGEISVPLTWKEIHKKYLSLLLGSANIFEAVKSIDDDPLKATLALSQYRLVIDGMKEMVEQAAKLIPE